MNHTSSSANGGWTSTKNKRASTTPSSSHVNAPPAKMMKKGGVVSSGGGFPRISSGESSFSGSSSSSSSPLRKNIDWEKRKEILTQYSNAAWFDSLTSIVYYIFEELRKEYGDASRTGKQTVGPMMLWHMLPPVMQALETTPFEWFCNSKDLTPEELQEGLTIVINWTLGDRGHDLSVRQESYRRNIMYRLKELLTQQLTKLCARSDIYVVYAKKFYSNNKDEVEYTGSQ